MNIVTLALRRLYTPFSLTGVALLAALGSGCMLEQSDGTDDSATESVGSIEEPLVLDSKIYTWGQGNGSTILGPGNGYSGATWTCFITGITGNFRGNGEFVRTYISQPAGGGVGTWRLGGASQQDGVSAHAVCVNRPPRAENLWQKGSNPIQLDTSSASVCGFTFLQGNFAGTGERATIEVDRNSVPPRWYLNGATRQASLNIRARCVDAVESIRLTNQADAYLASAGFGNACVLGYISGPLRSGGDKGYINLAPGGIWQLIRRGAPLPGARCML